MLFVIIDFDQVDDQAVKLSLWGNHEHPLSHFFFLHFYSNVSRSLKSQRALSVHRIWRITSEIIEKGTVCLYSVLLSTEVMFRQFLRTADESLTGFVGVLLGKPCRRSNHTQWSVDPLSSVSHCSSHFFHAYQVSNTYITLAHTLFIFRPQICVIMG